MLTKKGFDAAIAIIIGVELALPLVRMTGRRWATESTGICKTIGQALTLGM